eukprot:2027115-Rhodomonas_salina.1
MAESCPSSIQRFPFRDRHSKIPPRKNCNLHPNANSQSLKHEMIPRARLDTQRQRKLPPA